jgi:hypothetical protein
MRPIPRPNPKPDAADSTFANIVKLIQALVWPVLLLFLFLAFRDPFSRTIAEVPDLIGHASEMKIGGVSVTIEQQARDTGDAKLAAALKGLSPDARKLMLEVGTHNVQIWGAYYAGDTTHRRYFLTIPAAPMAELSSRGLAHVRDRESYNDPTDQIAAYNTFLRRLHLQQIVDPNDRSENLHFRAVTPLTPEQDKQLDLYEISLTDLGKKAYGVILDVVTHS